MSRALIGRERTRARRDLAEAIRVYPDAETLARATGLRRHTAAALIARRMLPGRRVAEAIGRVGAAMNAASIP